ncbi:MAG: hypothetical protein EXR72_19085 [Myxococcales bacterium]|nr:hypothetical protein [Myxococcales bacterium]
MSLVERGEPGARFEDGEVSYSDVASLQEDIDAYLAHGVIWAAGTKFPKPLAEFQFRLRLPDGTTLALLGQIISLRGNGALIQVLGWTRDHLSVVRAATQPRAPGSADPPPPPRNRTSTFVTPPPMAWAMTPPPAMRPVTPPPAALRAATPSPDARRSASGVFVQGLGVVGRSRAMTPTPRPGTPTPPPRAATPAPRAATMTRPGTPASDSDAATIPQSGLLRNPVTPAEVLELGIDPDAPLRRLPPQPSLMALVHWLGVVGTTGVLEVRGAQSRPIFFCQGRVLLREQGVSPEDAAIWPTASYQLAPCDESALPRAARSCSAWSFVARLCWRQMRDVDGDLLGRALPASGKPSLKPTALEVLGSLDLPRAERQFAEYRLQGRETLAELLHGTPVGAAIVQRLVATLHASRLLTWEGGAVAADPMVEQVQKEWEHRHGRDLFGVLGCHYSVAPSRLKLARDEVVADYGPQSKAHQVAGEFATKIVAEAERAWTALSDVDGRRRYRRDVLKIDDAAAAHLLYDQAETARQRSEYKQAAELLEAALDLDDKPAYRQALQLILARARAG